MFDKEAGKSKDERKQTQYDQIKLPSVPSFYVHQDRIPTKTKNGKPMVVVTRVTSLSTQKRVDWMPCDAAANRKLSEATFLLASLRLSSVQACSTSSHPFQQHHHDQRSLKPSLQ